MFSAFKKRYLRLDHDDISQQYGSSSSVRRVKSRNIPSRRVALFDIILASVSHPREDSSVTPYSIGYSMQRFDSVTDHPKSFVVTKKKKSLSSLKKKILLERLGKILDKLKLDGIEDSNTLCTVHLYNFVTPDDIHEEEERNEICSNVKELLHSFGHITSINIFKQITIRENSRCYVAITFNEAISASRAARSIDGLVFGGMPIQARLAAAESLAPSVSTANDSKENSHNTFDGSQSKLSGSVVCLEKMITASDVADPEEAAEVLSDLYSLCSTFGGIANIWIQKKIVDVSANNEAAARNPEKKQPPSDFAEHPWGLIEYSDLEDAIHSINSLNKRVISGEVLSATLFDYTAFFNQHYYEEHVIPLESAAQESYAVRLLSFVDRRQLEDEDEILEIINDIQSIFTERVPGLSIASIYFVAPSTQDAVVADATLDAIVSLPTLQDALVLVRFLGQQIISGEALAVHVEALHFDDQKLNLGENDVCNIVLYQHHGSSAGLVESQRPLVSRRLHSSSVDGAVVLIKNYFLSDDLNDARGKSEEMAALKRDLLQLTRSGSPYFEKGIVSRVCIVDGPDFSNSQLSKEKEEDEFTAFIEFPDDACAEEALLNLDGMTIGGTSVLAFRQKHQPAGSAEDGGHPTVTEAWKRSYPLSNDSGDCAYECVHSQSASELSPAQEKAPQEDGLDGQAETESLKIQPSSKYFDAKTAPRAPCHEITKQFIPSASEEIDEMIKEFLNLLAGFQRRAKEANPLKAKQKQRFLAGIKQTTNAVKAGMVKLIFLAPNTEALDVLDEKIDLLLYEAQSKDIPICYCLNKRKLGKAAQLSMKQSVLSIVDPDGAFELYRKIIDFIRPNYR